MLVAGDPEREAERTCRDLGGIPYHSAILRDMVISLLLYSMLFRAIKIYTIHSVFIRRDFLTFAIFNLKFFNSCDFLPRKLEI